MSVPNIIKGHCLCKAITYEITTETSEKTTTLICHCTHCQVSSGSIVSYNAIFPLGKFRVTSETHLTEYIDAETASGNAIIRCFCPKCGTAIVSKSVSSGMAFVKVPSFSSSLDDKSELEPGMEIFTRSKNSWEPSTYRKGIKQASAAPQ